MLAGVVLGAGAGSRFGPAPKLLQELWGEPLIAHALRAVADLERTFVVVRPGSGVARVAGTATVVECEDAGLGQSASLRAGVAAAREAGADGVVVVLGDEPLVTSQAVRRVCAWRDRADAVRATYRGVPGHPVLLQATTLEAVNGLRGDLGARGLLADALAVECSDVAARGDVDTPRALETLRRQPARAQIVRRFHPGRSMGPTAPRTTDQLWRSPCAPPPIAS